MTLYIIIPFTLYNNFEKKSFPTNFIFLYMKKGKKDPKFYCFFTTLMKEMHNFEKRPFITIFKFHPQNFYCFFTTLVKKMYNKKQISNFFHTDRQKRNPKLLLL